VAAAAVEELRRSVRAVQLVESRRATEYSQHKINQFQNGSLLICKGTMVSFEFACNKSGPATVFYGTVCYATEEATYIPGESIRIEVLGQVVDGANVRVPRTREELVALRLPLLLDVSNGVAVYEHAHRFAPVQVISAKCECMTVEEPAEAAARKSEVMSLLPHRIGVESLAAVPNGQIAAIESAMSVTPSWFRSTHAMRTRSAPVTKPIPARKHESGELAGGERKKQKEQTTAAQPQSRKDQRHWEQKGGRKDQRFWEQKGIFRTDCFNRSKSGTVLLLGAINDPTEHKQKSGLTIKAKYLIDTKVFNDNTPLLIIRVIANNVAEILSKFQTMVAAAMADGRQCPPKELTVVTYIQGHGEAGHMFNNHHKGVDNECYASSPLGASAGTGIPALTLVDTVDAILQPALQIYMVCELFCPQAMRQLNGRHVVGYTGPAEEGGLNPDSNLFAVLSKVAAGTGEAAAGLSGGTGIHIQCAVRDELAKILDNAKGSHKSTGSMVYMAATHRAPQEETLASLESRLAIAEATEDAAGRQAAARREAVARQQADADTATLQALCRGDGSDGAANHAVRARAAQVLAEYIKGLPDESRQSKLDELDWIGSELRDLRQPLRSSTIANSMPPETDKNKRKVTVDLYGGRRTRPRRR
jgi:hypothetical protein